MLDEETAHIRRGVVRLVHDEQLKVFGAQGLEPFGAGGRLDCRDDDLPAVQGGSRQGGCLWCREAACGAGRLLVVQGACLWCREAAGSGSNFSHVGGRWAAVKGRGWQLAVANSLAMIRATSTCLWQGLTATIVQANSRAAGAAGK